MKRASPAADLGIRQLQGGNMRRNMAVLILALTLAATSLAFADGTAAAGSKCSNALLRGRYSVHATGEITGIGPFATVGVFAFDGAGHAVASVVTRTSGTNGVSELEGVYSVNSDCSGSDTVTATNGSVSTHQFVIFGNGSGYFILNTTPGAPHVIIGEARRQ